MELIMKPFQCKKKTTTMRRMRRGKEILVNCCAASLQLLCIIKINLVETPKWSRCVHDVTCTRFLSLRYAISCLDAFDRSSPQFNCTWTARDVKVSIKKCKTINCIQIMRVDWAANRAVGRERRRKLKFIGDTHWDASRSLCAVCLSINLWMEIDFDSNWN